MGVIPDAQTIAAERATARAALAAAEQAMTEHSGDPEAFRVAKGERAQALEDLERLDWAEKHREQALADAKLAQQKADLDTAQAKAREARARAQELAARLKPILDELHVLVTEIGEANGWINRGVHFEQYAVRDGLLQRSELVQGACVHTDLAVYALRLAKELVKLSPVTMQTADIRATQLKL